MARRSVDVIASGMMVVRKRVRKDLGGGRLGLRQVRRVMNIVTDPRLISINECIASELGGKTFPTLGAVQSAFRTARQGKCKI